MSTRPNSIGAVSGMLQEFLAPCGRSWYIDLRIKSRADALANLLRPSKVDFPKADAAIRQSTELSALLG
jgi:hypothetical protein